jgi:anti-anti-sigma factor
MTMKVTTTITGDRAVLAIEGRFQYDAVMDYRQVMEPLAANPDLHHMEIDMSQTTYIDSSALGALLVTRDMSRKNKKTIALTNCRGDVLQVLNIARFDTLFTIT